MIAETMLTEITHFCRGKKGCQIEIEYGELEDA